MIDQIKDTIINTNKWYKTWRIIYPILGIVLIVELIFAAKTLIAPLPKVSKSSSQKLQLSKGAYISLISPKTNFKVGDNIAVAIQVSTGGYASSGTDLIFHFNPNILESSSTTFQKGKIYSEYPLVEIDNKLGVVRLSGVVSSQKQIFNGNGSLGIITFKAKNKGINTFKIDFSKGRTNDSNIISANSNTDVLEKVNDLKITVQ